MMPIIRWGLWERRNSIVSWSTGISAYIALNILVYGSIRGQSETLNKALENLPASAKALFGGSSDFLSPVGYLNSKLYFLMLPLLFTMLAITLSSSLFAKEEQNGTLELLLARPISRAKLLGAKLITAGIVMLAVAGVALGVTIVCAWRINYDISLLRLTQATGATVLISGVFGAVAWLLICVGKLGKHASVGGAVFIALGSYLINSLAGIASWLETPAKFVPYHYYDSSGILLGTYNWWHAFGLGALTLALLGLAFVAFQRRDIG